MSVKCLNCGEMNESDSAQCSSCGNKIDKKDSNKQVAKQLRIFSLLSLILGCVGMGFFWWFPVLPLNNIISLGNWVALSLFCLFMISAILGIIFGGLSVRKGKRWFSIIGLLFNAFTLFTLIWSLVIFILNFF
ncbi:MAG: hypothetical protein GPJ52_03135 [Candidatus Heimdallarchaeota archaeon]|nr:hypothetical protein [Candidatus Heimdallarchaeota archaeon]